MSKRKPVSLVPYSKQDGVVAINVLNAGCRLLRVFCLATRSSLKSCAPSLSIFEGLPKG